MLVSQYTYFALASTWMPATEITARLGIEPDEVTVRGSRLTRPPRPVAHEWHVVCRKPGLTVDEQMTRIIDRLFDHAERIGALAAELDRVDGESGASRLQVVRIFEHPEGSTSPIGGLENHSERHRLLGWHLDARAREFLRLTRAELDVDEYAYG
ncbi:hypothetical protein GCM10023195_70020 [Actinoallomurus liliacearum]|uniref:DUF4279 domain-containing protein n=1 Tax=Actinoallomurus liliacearum TaxID=1080073 RepID=A0ABP8TY47_9ACTN